MKTILRLIPVVICAMAFGMGMCHGEFFHVFGIKHICYIALVTMTVKLMSSTSVFTFTCSTVQHLLSPSWPQFLFPSTILHLSCILLSRSKHTEENRNELFLLFVLFLDNSVIKAIGQVELSNSTCIFDTNHLTVLTPSQLPSFTCKAVWYGQLQRVGEMGKYGSRWLCHGCQQTCLQSLHV